MRSAARWTGDGMRRSTVPTAESVSSGHSDCVAAPRGRAAHSQWHRAARAAAVACKPTEVPITVLVAQPQPYQRAPTYLMVRCAGLKALRYVGRLVSRTCTVCPAVRTL